MSQYDLIVTPRPGLWYFAHPYTILDGLSRPHHAAMEANRRLCCLRAARLVEAGWLIYAPVCHTHPIKAALPQFMAEHIGSNSMWFLTFRQLVLSQMTLWLFPFYTVGTVAGSVVGVRISMWIESWIGATSDGHIKPPGG